MYYTRVTNAQIRHQKGIKAGSGKHAPKKYDKAHLACSVTGCDNEFYIAMPTTDKWRYCEEHYGLHKKAIEQINAKTESAWAMNWIAKNKRKH